MLTSTQIASNPTTDNNIGKRRLALKRALLIRSEAVWVKTLLVDLTAWPRRNKSLISPDQIISFLTKQVNNETNQDSQSVWSKARCVLAASTQVTA